MSAGRSEPVDGGIHGGDRLARVFGVRNATADGGHNNVKGHRARREDRKDWNPS